VTRAYLALIRFPYHCSFAVVLLGVLTITRDFIPLLRSILLLYVIFNVFLYGGIYTVNAVADAPSDRRHPRKRFRPVASGTISRPCAAAFGILLIAAGLASGYALFPPSITRLFGAVLAVNLFYTFLARRIPYVDIAVNAATYPLRYLLGATLAGGSVSSFLLALAFLAALGGATFRRRLELSCNGTQGRPALSAYTPGLLLAIEGAILGAIGVLRLGDGINRNYFYLIAAATYFLMTFGADFYPPLRRAFARLWSA
jgi:4-hydroxybenzoate polyprenyltransferase